MRARLSPSNRTPHFDRGAWTMDLARSILVVVVLQIIVLQITVLQIMVLQKNGAR